MDVPKVIQGDDFSSTIKYNDDSGNPVALGTMSDYQAYIYYYDKFNNKKNLYTYKKTPVGNDSPIGVLDAYTQLVVLTREQSLDAPIGQLYLASSILLPASSNYINSLEKQSNERCICEVVTSPNPKALL